MASIDEYQTKSGPRWRVRWRHDGEPDSESFDDLMTAQKWHRLIELSNGDRARTEQAIADKVVSGATVAENMARHIELLTSAGPYQVKRYKSALASHFGGRLGAMPVAMVAHEDVVIWLREMQAKDLAPKTIANHHGLLSASFETAIRLGVRGDNPCRGIKLPKDESTAEVMRVLTPEEAKRIIEATPARYRVFVTFLLGSGARFGEATALTGPDFRLDAATPEVRIEKAWKADGANGFYVGPPKTRKSRRTVSLAPSTVEAVRPLVAAAGTGLVFTTSYGGPIRHSTFHEFWTRALDECGYPADKRPRMHDMRHTHGSWMLHAGMSIFELSRRLGHESVVTTTGVYGHLVPDAHFRGAAIAAKALEAL